MYVFHILSSYYHLVQISNYFTLLGHSEALKFGQPFQIVIGHSVCVQVTIQY